MYRIKNKNAFIKNLNTWYQESARALPWRETPSLYKTVVSEFMLQQTQVSTVLPYFDRWLKRFPDFETLAQAEEEHVVKHWEGLGYYTRARNLHKLAKHLSSLETIPTDAKSWQSFPGIGPYTSAAITSITFSTPEAVVDGNVIRILARLMGVETTFKDNTSAFKVFKPEAQALINQENPGDHNQAMMELGATVCHRQKPLCLLCPVNKLCKAYAQGKPEAYPKLAPRKTTQVTIDRVFILEEDQLLLHRTPSKAKRLANMCELPKAEDLKIKVSEKTKRLSKKRGISNQRISEHIHTPKLNKTAQSRIKESDELFWTHKNDLNTLTLSGPHKRWILELLG
tara:strand:- start:7115 stop:8137 length:1023 start_codon:yes stop_codon:yes gene_type:complete